MPPFDIRLLGSIEVWDQGQPLTGFRSQKTLGLLAYVVVEDRPQTRDFLAGLLWPEETQGNALGHLRRALHNLTRLLPGCLEVDRRTVRFSPTAPASVDVRTLTELAAGADQADPAVLAQAAALARAPFLEGVYLTGCPEFETWVTIHQERLRQQVVALLERLVSGHSTQGAYHLALPYAQQLARLDPVREAFHRLVMRLLAYTGQREAALLQYGLCRQALDTELGLPVSPETTELYERLLAMPEPAHNLPPDPTPFIGREAALAELAIRRADPACRLLTLVGPGGSGKTRLALALARRLVNTFIEGVWYVELAGVESADLVPGAIAQALGLPLSGRASVEDQLLERLAGRESLLVLDNFEHLAAAGGADFLARLMPAAAQIRLLVTSRQQLNLREEWLYAVSGLTYPADDASEAAGLADLRAYESVTLFETTLGRAGIELEAAALNPVVSICRLVQGAPLALELAAAAVRRQPLEQVALALRDNLDALQSTLRNVPERHRSVRAAFDHSWKLLDPAAQAALARAAVFRGGFTAQAAEVVAGVPPPQLEQLAAHSLVRRSGAARYEVHELLRQYAWERLAADAAEAVQQRHADFYAAWMAGKESALAGDEGHAARTAITTELGNVRDAWRWAVAHQQWDPVARSMHGLARYYEHFGRLQEFLPLLTAALAQAPAGVHSAIVAEEQPGGSNRGNKSTKPAFAGLEGLNSRRGHKTRMHPPAAASVGPPELPARLLALQAYVLVRLGQVVEAAGLAAQAIRLAQAAGDAPAEVEATYTLAVGRYEQGSYAECQAAAEHALGLARRHGLARYELLCLQTLGLRSQATGELNEARQHFARMLALAQALPHRRLEMLAESKLGNLDANFGHTAAGEVKLRRALALAQQHGFQGSLGSLNLTAGLVALYQGKYADVRRHLEAALAAYRREGNGISIGLAYTNLAILTLDDTGDFHMARQYLRQALAIYQPKGARAREADARLILGYTMLALGEYREAREQFGLVQQLGEATGGVIPRLKAHWRLAHLALELGDWVSAQHQLEQADVLLQKPQRREYACWIAGLWSRLWHERGDLAQAHAYGQQALALAREQSPRLITEGAIRLANVLADMDNWPAAQDLYAEALGLWQERHQPHLAAEAEAGLAHSAWAQGQTAAARRQLEPVLRHLAAVALPQALALTQERMRLWWTCCAVLHGSGEPAAAAALLGRAQRWLQAQAATLEPGERHRYLHHVQAHRLIMTACEAGWRAATEAVP